MAEIYWVDERGLCVDRQHAYKIDGNRWSYPTDRTAIRMFIKSNGVVNYEFVCTVNGCRWHSAAIPNELAKSALKKLPILEPRQSDYAGIDVCGYRGCESTDVERHHYAPRNTFGFEADNFPCLPLCRDHHRYWHQKMDGYQWRQKSTGYYRDPEDVALDLLKRELNA